MTACKDILCPELLDIPGSSSRCVHRQTLENEAWILVGDQDRPQHSHWLDPQDLDNIYLEKHFDVVGYSASLEASVCPDSPDIAEACNGMDL